VTFVLETLRGDESLDLGRFGVGFLALAFGLDFPSDHKFSNIIFLVETKEFADFGGALGTEAFGVDNVSQAWDVTLSLLDDRESEDGEILSDDAATNGLALAFTSSAWAVAGMAVGEEEFDTSWEHHTLLHRKSLLVIASSDAKNIALPLVTKAISRNLVAHALLHKDAKLALIFNFDQLLRPVGRVGNIELHLND